MRVLPLITDCIMILKLPTFNWIFSTMTVWGNFSFNFDNKIKVDWSVSGGPEGVKIRKKTEGQV